MRILKIPYSDVFRASEGEHEISFVPDLKSGRNYVSYLMHWLTSGERSEAFLCQRILNRECPICELQSTNSPEYKSKDRVLINTWKEGEQTVKIWDVNRWLLTRALGDITDSRLYDTTKYGIKLFLVVRRRERWPEYIITKESRRFEIPSQIVNQAYNLTDLIYVPTEKEFMSDLDNYLNYGTKTEVQITESVGEVFTGKRTTKEFENIIKVSKKKVYKEPEPYKRVKRIIILDE